MEWNDLFTKDQLARISKIKNPTVTKVIELSEELDVEIETLAKYFITRNLELKNKDN